MNKVLVFAGVALLMTGVLLSSVGYAQATRNVTIVVNTATAPDTLIPKSSVRISGNFNGWGAGDSLANIGGDYWSKTFAWKAGDTVFYKIRPSGAWEQNVKNPYGIDNGNRSYIVADKDTTLPLQFFNNDTVGNPQYFRPWSAVADTFINVYFRVNMHGPEQANLYNFNVNKDTVGVRGGGGGDLNWSPTFYLKKEKPANNGGFAYDATHFWSGRLRIPKNAVTAGQDIAYKFMIGYDWGRNETFGNPPPPGFAGDNRHFTIPVGKKDTTLRYSWFQELKPSPRPNNDTLIVTYVANMTNAVNSGGFNAANDTLEVTTGDFGTIAGNARTKRMFQQIGSIFQAKDTVVTSRDTTLDYQYYVYHGGSRYRENYYNFYYAGPVQSEAERRQIIVPRLRSYTIYDTATAFTNPRRQPDLPNARKLARPMTVKFEVDIRPAYYQVLRGDTLVDIQSSFNVIKADSVYRWAVWINGQSTGAWAGWGGGLFTDTTRKMWDDGTHGDVTPRDSVFTRIIKMAPDSTGGTMMQVGQVFKFGLHGGDNEGGRGGFGNNHTPNVVDATSSTTLRSQWGSMNPRFYNAWDYDNGRPAVFVGVKELPGLPGEYALAQNYPNPFNPSTKIEYSVPLQSFVTLKVYNLIGQEVATLVNELQRPARYVATLDASKFATGVYFYRLSAGSFVSTRKMLLLK